MTPYLNVLYVRDEIKRLSQRDAKTLRGLKKKLPQDLCT